jgi:hypothetical protein
MIKPPKIKFFPFNERIEDPLFKEGYIPKITNPANITAFNNIDTTKFWTKDNYGLIKELNYNSTNKISSYYILAQNQNNLERLNLDSEQLIKSDYVQYGDMFIIHHCHLEDLYIITFVKI